LLLVFATAAGVGVAVAVALALAFAARLVFAVLSQPAKTIASAANAISPVILRLMRILLAVILKTSSENVRSRWRQQTMDHKEGKKKPGTGLEDLPD
jgi:Mg2+/Co2+ transporter CorB